jgi:hypothetical protein
LKVAVLPEPGTLLPAQFVEVAQVASVVPLHVSLAAQATGLARASPRKAPGSATARKIRGIVGKSRGVAGIFMIVGFLRRWELALS